MSEAVLAGLFGLLIGSFLNVCIYRWPRDESVIRPRSHCTQCGATITWYDNFPILSWVLLRAKCRHCGALIHWRYPVVEALTGLAFFWFVWRFGAGPAALKYCVFSALLIGMVFSDLETLLLPDEFTLGGLVLGLVFAGFVQVPDAIFPALAQMFGYTPGWSVSSLGEAILGAAVPAAMFWLLGWLFEKIRKKEGLGLGDVKMIAMIGAFLGIGGVLLTIIAAALIGSVVGLLYIRMAAKDAATYQLPFGAFLGAAAFFAAIAGPNILAWYGETLR